MNGEIVFFEDRRLIVVVDVGKYFWVVIGFVKQFYVYYLKMFIKVVVYVICKLVEGEVNGKDFYFVDIQVFNMMWDGDQFFEFSEEGDDIYGISRKVVDVIVDNDRVVVMEMIFEVSFQYVLNICCWYVY